MRASSARNGRISRAPSAQLRPTLNGRACAIDTQKASIVWPESVRPLLSVIVTEIMTGTSVHAGSFAARASNSSWIATMAAFALSVSKIVSTRSTSAPPSTRPRTCSR